MSQPFGQGDVLEALEDCDFNTIGVEHGQIRGNITRILTIKEGDMIQNLGTEFYNKSMYYKMLFIPCNENGEPIGTEIKFYISNIRRFLSCIGYRLED